MACGRRCGRRGAANACSADAASLASTQRVDGVEGSPSSRRQRVVADRRRTQPRIRKYAALRDERLPRARAALRRWSARALEVTQVLTFGLFDLWCKGRAALAALSILLAQDTGTQEQAARARANRRKSTRRIGRAHGSRDLAGTALPELCLHICTPRVEHAAWGNAYLENLPRGPHSSGSAAGGAASLRGTEMVPYLE